MNMQIKHLLPTSVVLLVAASTSFAADSTVVADKPAATTQAKLSKGLLNDWLQERKITTSGWDVGGQIRLRGEGRFNNGVAGATDFRRHGGDNDMTLLFYRIRPHLAYNGDYFGFMVEGRHSDTVSDERPVHPEDDVFDLHQAYLTLGNAKEYPVSLRVGRQELSYGDERLVGASAWNNIGRVFDAGKVQFKGETFTVDAFTGMLVIPNNNNFNVPNNDDWFSGLYATTKVVPKNSLDLYFLARNAGKQSVYAFTGATLTAPMPRDIYTLGLRLKSNPDDFGNWDYTAELMGQFGHFNDPRIGATAPNSLTHEAFALSLTAGHTWRDNSWKPRLALGYDFASGDSNPTDGKHTTFENLFPTNHKFYGFMDTVSLQNVHDVRLSASIKPHKKVNATLDYHNFWLANKGDNFYTVSGASRGGIGSTPGTGYGRNTTYGNYLGSELDLVISYNVCRDFAVQAGFGQFFVGKYIASTWSANGNGSADGTWGYLQATVSF
jgi:hypothetical protein